MERFLDQSSFPKGRYLRLRLMGWEHGNSVPLFRLVVSRGTKPDAHQVERTLVYAFTTFDSTATRSASSSNAKSGSSPKSSTCEMTRTLLVELLIVWTSIHTSTLW
jgi:hypothetical protein